MRASAFGLVGIAAAGLLAGGCCKSLDCAAQRAARELLACQEVELRDVTDEVRRLGHDVERGRRVQRAKGCQRSAHLECGLLSSGVLVDEVGGRHQVDGEVRPELADPQWRCWSIPEPLGGGKP